MCKTGVANAEFIENYSVPYVWKGVRPAED